MNKLVQECSYFMFGDENEYVGEDQMLQKTSLFKPKNTSSKLRKKNLTIVTTYKFDNSYYYNYLN